MCGCIRATKLLCASNPFAAVQKPLFLPQIPPHMKNALLACFALLTVAATAQVKTRSYLADEALTPRERVVDFTHLKLQVAFEPEAGKVNGTVTHTFTVLRKEVAEIELDAVRMDVSNLTLDGAEVPFEQTETVLTIKPTQPLAWDTEHTLVISYSCTPRRGLYFIGWNSPPEGISEEQNASRKQIWTQGQGIDNRQWIPMFDMMNDKVVTEMLVTFDSKYKVLSNGALIKHKSNKDGTDLWHYKIGHPHAPYLIMLGIGEYEIETRKSASGVPIHLWYYPDQPENVEPTYRYTVEMFDWFENEIGVPYPWGSYAQIPVQDFMFGAMENTTATLFGDFYYVDERGYADKSYVRVNAHELAHQWFGDMITARTSAHHWLQESFATHYDATYQGVAFGEDHFNWVRRKANNDALDESRKNLRPIMHSQAGVVRHYPKGAFVLQMLKYVVGREQFNRAVKHYLTKHAYDNVDSEDLLVAFHESLGLSLDWFWEQWVYRGGEPEYRVAFEEATTDSGRKGIFTVEQVHETNDVVGLFKMPIWFEVHYSDGSKTAQQVWIEEQHHRVALDIPAGKTVAYVLFDPNNQIMKSGSFVRPVEMYRQQAQHAEFMLDRYDALVALRSESVASKRDLLTQLYKKETFHATKAEIVSQLLEDPNSIDLLRSAIADADPLVNQAVVDHDKPLPESLKKDLEQLLSSSKSYWTVEKALDKLCKQWPDDTDRWLELTRNEVGFRGRNLRCQWLGIAFAHTGNQAYADELVRYTSNAYDFQTRVNASQALKKVSYCNAQLVSYLCDAIGSSNSRLAGPCGSVLQHFSYALQYSKLVRKGVDAYTTGGAADWQIKKVQRYL